jgi:hypothetical protein
MKDYEGITGSYRKITASYGKITPSYREITGIYDQITGSYGHLMAFYAHLTDVTGRLQVLRLSSQGHTVRLRVLKRSLRKPRERHKGSSV